MTDKASAGGGPWIGRSVPRFEDRRLLTGAGRFTDDLAALDALHAVFVRSPHAHALIRAVDAAAARRAGAAAVFTGDDLAAAGVGPIPNPTATHGAGYAGYGGFTRPNPPLPVLARGRVRHVGEAVAVVVAATPEAAQDAAEAVRVEYEPLPAVVSVAAADAPDAPLLWDELPGNLLCHNIAGDAAAVEAAFARAAHVVDLELVNNRLVVNFLEPRGCLAAWDAASGRITLRLGSQGVHIQAQRIAAALGLARERLRVVSEDVGGGFGALTGTYPEAAACTFAALALQRSVKWRGTRSEGFVSDTQARDHVTTGALALDAEGRILALRVVDRFSLGAYVTGRQPGSTVANMVRMLCGCYAIPAASLDIRGFVTNTVPINVYRGVGRFEDLYVLERLLDRAAGVIGLDRAELRRRNLVAPAALPWRTPTDSLYDSGDFPARLQSALAKADWAGFPARRAEAAKRGRLRGIGIACVLEGAGGVADEYGAIAVRADGTVELATGALSQGQGHATVFAQVAADLLELPIEAIRIVAGDTDRVASGVGTFASRSMIKAGGAAVEAGRKLLDEAMRRAGDTLEAPTIDIAYARGRFTVVGTDRSVSLFELAAEAPLAADANHYNERVAWPNGAHVCEVEVDPETGFVEILRYVAVDDVGRAVNPAIVHGQTIGAVAQGLGQGLFERCVYDPATGQLLTGSLMDYALPRAADLPPIETWIEDVPTATNALGVKGAGEAGTVAAPCAAMSAVLDALAPLGVTHLDMPAVPEAVWRAIRAGQP